MLIVFSDFFFPVDTGEQIETDVEGFGCGTARLDRNDNVGVETFGCAWNGLKVVAVGVTLRFYFDVFHCTFF